MFMSLIVCTKDRAPQLQLCLKEIAAAAPPPCAWEIVLVDNGSSDATESVIAEFAETPGLNVTRVDCAQPGLGRARNVGIAAAKGEWLLFTDDDCYIEKTFLQNFHEFAMAVGAPEAKPIRYGAGPILLYDARHDPRIANLAIDTIRLIPPNTLVPPGAVQGANMFFHSSIFRRIGGFNDKMGSGTPFACEDIEMAARASFAGFLGAQLPFFKVVHHHKRLAGSAEANRIVDSYDYGRGAYFASLIDKGYLQVWKLWEARSQLLHDKDPLYRVQLAREFEGAAKYLNALQ
jgi:glycosyltransferase involved in cell wall biosynthesis